MKRVTLCSLSLAFALGGAAAGNVLAADGVIVQLRDALPHAAADRAQALSAGGSGATLAARVSAESARWHRVLANAPAPAGAAAEPVPNGSGAYVLRGARVLSDADLRAWAERLASQPEVAWAVPNEREHRLQVPNDPYFASPGNTQWWLYPHGGTDAQALADRRRGVPGMQTAWRRNDGATAPVLVALLDTGITPHAELAGRTVGGYDFVSNPVVANDGDGRDADPSDPGDWVDASELSQPAFRDCAAQPSSWHGTMTAGLLAAATNNGAGVAAISWNGRVVPVRVAGKCGAAVADIIDGMRWAAGLAVTGVPGNPHPARIVSVSFGGAGACNAAYQQAIDEVRARGTLVIAAAGNEHGALTRPANCRGVVGVVALNRDGFKTTYSNFGAEAAIATVGGDNTDGRWGPLLGDGGLLSIYNDGVRAPGNGSYAYLFGSSFSAPIVAGTVGLMLGVHPSMTVDQIVAGLRASARPHVQPALVAACSRTNPGRCACTATTCGAGILDADEAVRYAQELAAGRTYTAPVRPAEMLDSAELRQAVALGADRLPNPEATVVEPVAGSAGSGGGGGGGALGLPVLGALGIAVLALRRRR